MKIALFLVGTLATSAIWTSIANAGPAPGPKRPGPSAVEAARLKRYPAPSYLAHYLPDDRYKIAGGVWKYVSTDLDTYYHVPSSPNMLRQPASRVIGFATARDAEEAGYVADPSDGTLGASSASSLGFSNGRDAAEQKYLSQVSNLLLKNDAEAKSYFPKLKQALGPRSVVSSVVRQMIEDALSERRGQLAQVSALRPPSRLRRLHPLIVALFRSYVTSTVNFAKVMTTNDSDVFKQMEINFDNDLQLVHQIEREAHRLHLTTHM